MVFNKMTNAVITYINDNLIDNLEKDFLESLRKEAKFKGEIYVLYYGNSKRFVKKIEKKYKVNVIVIISKNKYTIYNQRNIEIAELIKKLPKNINNIMCIDGGDVWFQKPIEDIFDSVKDSYGFIEEIQDADSGFNLQSINKLDNKNAQKAFLNSVKGFKLINSGMIVGKREILEKLFYEMARLTEELNKDYYGFDQAIFNYVLRSDGRGISLPKKYCFPIFLLKNQFEVKNKLFHESETGELINIVHNLGWYNRILPNGRKDITNIPKMPKKLSGSFWGITTYFNPVKYKNKIENYRKFRENSKKQDLKLLCVELAFNNEPFELNKEDADILIQLRTKNILWQKERLVNIGIKNLPKDCDKFAWLDGDIIFLNDNWVKETCKLLESYAIIQPFSVSIRLPKGMDSIDTEQKVLSFSSVSPKPDRYKTEGFSDVNKIPFGNINDLDGFKSNGVAYRVSQLGKAILDNNIDVYGHVGMAWAGRKSIFEKHGILDKSIFSNSDSFMVHLFYNNRLNKECEYFATSAMEKEIVKWSDEIFPNIKGSVYYTNGIILHLWHGSAKNRNYQECNRILNEYEFNPSTDLKLDDNKCWAWASDKKALHRAVKRYFLMRKEDDSIYKSIYLFFYNLFNFYDKNIPNFTEKIQKFRNHIFFLTDRGIGLAGLSVKKISPSFYYDLRSLKESL